MTINTDSTTLNLGSSFGRMTSGYWSVFFQEDSLDVAKIVLSPVLHLYSKKGLFPIVTGNRPYYV